MMVEVKVYSTLIKVFGASSVQIQIDEKTTLADLIAYLINTYGEAFREETGRDLAQALERRYNLFLNGKIIKLPADSGLRIKNQDKIIILQPVGGG